MSAPPSVPEAFARRALASVVWIALLVAACTGTSARPSHLVAASVRQPATSLLFVAQGSGCFAREQVTLDERPFELGRDALELLRSGSADVAIAYETPLLRAALRDPRLRVLSKLHTSTSNTRLVTRATSGIRAFSDLRGKRISRARGTNADFFAEVALASGGLGPDSARLVDLPPDRAVAALEGGEVDAAVLSDPYAEEAERLLGPDVRTLVTQLYVEASLLITRDDVLATKAPALEALARALACAEQYAQTRPADAAALVLPRFPEQPAAAVTRQLQRVTWGIGLDNVLLDVLRREREWLDASTPRASRTDLRDLVAPELLDRVAPETVTLLPESGGGPRW